VSKENDALRELVEQAQSNPRVQEEQDIDDWFDEADIIDKGRGQNVLLHLRKSLQEGGKEKFISELRTAIKSPYLDENDISAMHNLCGDLDLDAHQIAVLREARKRFPESQVFFTYYTNALLRSPSREHQTEGSTLAEEYFGITKTDDQLQVEKTQNITDIEELFPLFDYYIRNNKPAWALALLDAAEPMVGDNPLLLRNKARALTRLRKYAEAEDVFKEAINRSPSDALLLSFYSDFLDDTGQYKEAYEQEEKALRLESTVASRYVSIAIQILNRGYCRNESGEIHRLVPRKARLKAAAPFLIAAETRAEVRNRTQEVINLFARDGMVEEAQSLAQGQIPGGDYDYCSFNYIFPYEEQLTPQQ